MCEEREIIKRNKMEKEGYLYEGELVDTRNGFTYRDIYYEINEKEEVTFYEYYYGAKGEDFNGGTYLDSDYGNKIDDESEIEDLKRELKTELSNEKV